MNNTTKRNLALAAVFMAAILVVGTFATTTIATTQTAFAYSPKKDNKKDGSGNGNTITIQKCKQAATQSGFDNNQGQECENLICTHPGENATCVQEGAVSAAAVQAQPVKLTCKECFTKFLTSNQISTLLALIPRTPTLDSFCAFLDTGGAGLLDFENILGGAGIPANTIAELVHCLISVGINFQ